MADISLSTRRKLGRSFNHILTNHATEISLTLLWRLYCTGRVFHPCLMFCTFTLVQTPELGNWWLMFWNVSCRLLSTDSIRKSPHVYTRWPTIKLLRLCNVNLRSIISQSSVRGDWFGIPVFQCPTAISKGALLFDCVLVWLSSLSIQVRPSVAFKLQLFLWTQFEFLIYAPIRIDSRCI